MVRLVSPIPWASMFLSLLSAGALAQADSTSHACEGLTVSHIVVRAKRPPFAGASSHWQAAAHAVGLHHATTREPVVLAFMALHPGKPCTEFRRAESERILRAQPFLSDATVLVEPDTGGTVVVIVTTVDEAPVLVNARFRGVVPEAFSLGNENIGGLALLLQAHAETGDAYRTTIGGVLQQSALFNRPYLLILSGDRYHVGYQYGGELSHPFYTDLQRLSWHTGFEVGDDYPRFERPAQDPLALQANMQSWDANATLRIYGTSTVTLLGGAIGGRDFSPANHGIIVSDSGIVADTGIALNNKYRPFRVGRLGVIGGIRRVNYQTETGFDALVGSQDVARGAALAVYLGGGVPALGEADMLVSSVLYLGAANRNAYLATLAEAEARRAPDGDWDSVIGSARTAFYWGSAPGLVFAADDRLSFGRNSILPFQLSFRDPEAGMPGYRNSGLAGAVRNVVRAELRASAESVVRNADLGAAVFSELGTLWAGDVPYGTNATRASIGFSLLGAYPSRAKRLYRADVVFPFTRNGTGAGGIEFRFTSYDRSQAFWIEPPDVSSARTGTEPSRLFAWPSR